MYNIMGGSSDENPGHDLWSIFAMLRNINLGSLMVSATVSLRPP